MTPTRCDLCPGHAVDLLDLGDGADPMAACPGCSVQAQAAGARVLDGGESAVAAGHNWT